jgi:stage II sporulation protein D
VKVNESESLDADSRVYTIRGSGITSRTDLDGLYTISGSGSTEQLNLSSGSSSSSNTATPTNKVVTVSGSTYTVEGAGNGHQLGMSQYGAYAMAQQGFDYDEIVEFYYPGVRVGAY